MKINDPPPQTLHPQTGILANEIQQTPTPITAPQPTPQTPTDPAANAGTLSDAKILSGLKQIRDQIFEAETNQVFLASEWAKTHLTDLATEVLRPTDTAEHPWFQIAGLGRPDIEDFYLPEFAQTAGLTEHQARKLVRASIMLTHLLPRVWDKVLLRQIEVYRARLLAEQCWDLTPAAIEFIDHTMANSPAQHTETGRKNMITEAKQRYMADTCAQEEEATRHARHVTIDTRDHGNGLAHLVAALDLPEAIIIDAALTQGAAFYKAHGSEEPLDIRRTYALVDLAHNSLNTTNSTAPDSTADAPAHTADGDPRPRWDGTGIPTTKVRFFVHLNPNTTTRSTASSPTGAVEVDDLNVTARITGTGLPAEGRVLPETTVRDWITRHRAGNNLPVSITGVIDLNKPEHTRSYTATSRIKTHLHLRNRRCVFPFCTKSAIRADSDHIQPWDTDTNDNPTGGATCTCNLAPLCRSHHLLKTHGQDTGDGSHTTWTYTPLGEGKYVWSGPNNATLLVTPNGTYPTTPNPSADPNPTPEPATPAKVTPVHELTRTAARAHQKLWKKKNHFDTTTNLTKKINNHLQKFHRGPRHPNRDQPKNNASTDSKTHTNGPPPF